jgi:hypothetical protein
MTPTHLRRPAVPWQSTSMPSEPRLTDPGAIAARGESIYAERYRDRFEREFRGEFAVIDVTTGEAYHAPSPEEAIRMARERAPKGLFHLIRIGEPGAFRVSYTAKSAASRLGSLR